MGISSFFKPDPWTLYHKKKDTAGLIKALGYRKDDMVRRQAAVFLGHLGALAGPDAALALVRALDDESPMVRRESAKALAFMRPSLPDEALPALIARLDDSVESVRWMAALSLGKLGDPRAIEPLVHTVSEDASDKVREFAIVALGAFRTSSDTAANCIAQGTEDENGTVRRTAEEVQGGQDLINYHLHY